MHKRFALVSLVIAAAVPALVLAQESPNFSRCIALVKEGNVAAAEPFCADASEDSGKDGKLLYGDFLALKGDGGGAIRQYTAVLEGADRANLTQTEFLALRYRAFEYFATRNPAGHDDARVALARAPNDVELLTAGAQGAPSDRLRLEYADRLVELEPGVARHHVLRSFALSSAERGPEAFAAAKIALGLEPDSALALTARGYAYSALGKHAKAERDHAAVARKVPDEPAPRVNRAEALIKLGRFDAAIASANEALALNPAEPRAFLARANANLSLGKGEEVLGDLERVRTLEAAYVVGEMRYNAEQMIETQLALTRESIDAMEKDRSIVAAGNGAEVNEARQRLAATAHWVHSAEPLRCSKMPKKARCVDDKLFARALAAAAGFGESTGGGL